MPLVIGETFGEDLGPRRPPPNRLRATPRPNIAPKIGMSPAQLVIEGQMGHQTVPLIIQIYPIWGLMGIGPMVYSFGSLKCARLIWARVPKLANIRP